MEHPELDFRQRPISHVYVPRFPIRSPMLPSPRPPSEVNEWDYIQENPQVMSSEEAKEIGNKYSIPY